MVFAKEMNEENSSMSRQDKARKIVFDYAKARIEKTDVWVEFEEKDVYVVWFCKTLQNWKALVSTNLSDGMYYEVTYDGEKCQTYVDAYKKWENFLVKDEEFYSVRANRNTVGE